MSKAHVEVTEEVITPAKATQYLATMVANRTVSDIRVIDYALIMDEGEWVLNGETIKFDAAGRLIDGQHRLKACELAGKAFKTMVARGITDEKAFSTIDVGKTRTAGDIFSIAGITDPNNISAATLLIFFYKKRSLTVNGPRGRGEAARLRRITKGTEYANSNTGRNPSKEDLLTYAQEELGLEKLKDSLTVARACGARSLIPVGQLTGLHYLFAEKNREQADAFMLDLGKGENLKAGDPVLTLREKLISARMSTARLTKWAILLLTMKAWNKRRQGDTSRQLKVISNEEFPKLI